MYNFISGYNAKVAGTERSVAEPTVTFSPCFGSPFMVMRPLRYAPQLDAKVQQHRTSCWFFITGRCGRSYGSLKRISILRTRAILRAILNGTLAEVECVPDPLSKVDVSKTCLEVPSKMLLPRATWLDPSAYNSKAVNLVRLFNEHITEYEGDASELRFAALEVDSAL